MYNAKPTYFQQYQEFAALCSIPTRLIDSPANLALAATGWRLIEEEWRKELVPAWEHYRLNPSRENFVELTDGIVDSIYVLLDFAHKLGIPFDACWDAVQKNNMSKVWPDGTVHKDEHGKVMKPPGFQKVPLFEVIHEVSNKQCKVAKAFGAENWGHEKSLEVTKEEQKTWVGVRYSQGEDGWIRTPVTKSEES